MEDSGQFVPDENWENWDPKKVPFYVHTIAGISAGISEHCVMFPFDTIKTNLQANRKRLISFRFRRGISKRLIQNRGFRKLWNGFASLFFGCIPAHAAYFTVFEQVKSLTRAYRFGDSITGILASCAHDIFMVPMDCIKQRLQLGKYHGRLTTAICTIIKKEGFLALYRSYPTTLLMNIPFSAIMIPFNEHFKNIFNPTGKINIPVFFLSGGISAVIAAAFTCPLDVCKTRLQTQNITALTKIHHKVIEGPDYVYRFLIKYVPYDQLPKIKYEGVTGFFKGMAPRLFYVFPGSGLSWCVYESVKRIMNFRFNNI